MPLPVWATKIEAASPHQQEAATLRFHILPVSFSLVTGSSRLRIILFIGFLNSNLVHAANLAAPLTINRHKNLAARMWEPSEEANEGLHQNSIDLDAPPAGPPVWEQAPQEDETAQKPLDTSQSPAMAPKPVEPQSEAKVDKPEEPPLATPPTPPKVIESVVTSDGQVVLPSEDTIADELGFKTTELKRYVEYFARSISSGPRSSAFRKLCARDEESCRLLADFQAQASDALAERRRKRRRVKRFRITEENVSQAQRFDFQVLANNLRIESVEKLNALASKSLQETDCPRNLSASLSLKAEEFYPDAQARALARQLFEHSRACLNVADEVYERLYLRFGLYAIYEGDRVRAQAMLQEALKATKPVERYRVLYWLGKIAFDDGALKGKDNEFWTELMNNYPLSFYAIDASASLGRDPVEMITQRKVGGLKREVANEPELNRMIRWLEALYLYKQSNAVAKWASWIVRANEGELDVDVLLYLSSLKIASGLYRSNIQMLFSYFRKNPSALNSEGLKLLYPRPYFDLIQDEAK
jgi:hypothetical protein